MYKVMLIDDDVLMLKFLRQLIDWEKFGLRICADAYSSVKALDKFKQEKPDIVVSDIGLPQLNGLQLADQFKRLKPDVRIIFLTCYEDFHYLKQALHMNADDYLLKDQLTAPQLEDTLRKSMKAIEDHIGFDAQSAYREDFKRNLDVLKSSFFDQLLKGSGDEGTLRGYAERLGMRWDYPLFKLSIGNIVYSSLIPRYPCKDVEVLRYSVYNIASELSDRQEGIDVFHHKGGLAVLFNFRSSATTRPQEYLEGYLGEVRRACMEYLKIDLRFMHSPDASMLGAIRDVYKRMLRNKYQDFYSAPTHVGWNSKADVYHPAGHMFDAAKKELIKSVQEANDASLNQSLGQMQAIAREHRINPPEWIQSCVDTVRFLELKFANKTTDEAFYSILESTLSSNDLLSVMKWKLSELIGEAHAPVETGMQEAKLRTIDEYLISNLSENVGSLDMALHLGLNASYFSRYFKRLTGENFTDYVHKFKMGIAAKMLENTDDMVESVAMKLGYYERSYFSKIFKKYAGMTPSELRNKGK
jgi:two-component system response regulator YesN